MNSVQQLPIIKTRHAVRLARQQVLDRGSFRIDQVVTAAAHHSLLLGEGNENGKKSKMKKVLKYIYC